MLLTFAIRVGFDKIGIMGSVLDIASEKEIEDFYSSNVVEITNTNVTDNSQVEFNEDNDYLQTVEQKKSSIEIKTNAIAVV